MTPFAGSIGSPYTAPADVLKTEDGSEVLVVEEGEFVLFVRVVRELVDEHLLPLAGTPDIGRLQVVSVE